MRALTLDERLNRDCFCIDVDPGQVWAQVDQAAGRAVSIEHLKRGREHLFSNEVVFLSDLHFAAMKAVVSAIEACVELPTYREAALSWAPEIAQIDPGPCGVFMGYDFHLTADGPKLIEINTNAGGAFLNAHLARARSAACSEIEARPSAGPRLESFEETVRRMFASEWMRQGRAGGPKTIAIVDETPKDQYLYPEFLLAQSLFESFGVDAVIADPRELSFDGEHLWRGGLRIDLVYNRLVDFAFEQSMSTALRAAYLASAVVVTPNPRNHALLADKRNLTLLSNTDRLSALGVDAALHAILLSIPSARLVTDADAMDLWARRKSLFFKPAGGHAGKAVYRGDKLTRGTWSNILSGDFIAQSFAPPSERCVEVDGAPQPRKMDVRLYTYAGEVISAAARLYHGQTTNFRTPGGGFAPVVVVEGADAGTPATFRSATATAIPLSSGPT